jgi:hypothetical protein
MKGEYFSWLSHDDLYCPQKIEKQIEFLNNSGRKDLILFSRFDLINEKSEKLKTIFINSAGPGTFKVEITLANNINGCTLLIPSKCFTKHGLFNESLRTTQDYDMWFRLASTFDFVLMPEILIKSRQHEGQDTRKMKQIVLDECNDLLIGFLKELKKEEIIAFTKVPLWRSYLIFADSFQRRGFIKAGQSAINFLREMELTHGQKVMKRFILGYRTFFIYPISRNVKLLYKYAKLFQKV